jgi:hypothetical protein
VRPVVLALPRSGSAWLASYLGYLHDPILHRDPFLWGPNAGVVDTGAAYNPEKAWRKYEEGPACVLLRDPTSAWRSLVKLNHSVTMEDVGEWDRKLYDFATGNNLPVFWYEDIFHPLRSSLESLCHHMNCEYDYIWAENARQLHIEHPYGLYTREAWDRYTTWIDA